jgi:hypothetical protein
MAYLRGVYVVSIGTFGEGSIVLKVKSQKEKAEKFATKYVEKHCKNSFYNGWKKGKGDYFLQDGIDYVKIEYFGVKLS